MQRTDQVNDRRRQILDSDCSHGAHERQVAAGKWLYFGPTEDLHLWANKLNELVESGSLLAAKIARKSPEWDPVPHKPCVVCVYAYEDESSKDQARSTLRAAFGVEVSVWKSELETEVDWAPDGRLRIELETVVDQQK
jgi:hypothetical protein